MYYCTQIFGHTFDKIIRKTTKQDFSLKNFYDFISYVDVFSFSLIVIDYFFMMNFFYLSFSIYIIFDSCLFL